MAGGREGAEREREREGGGLGRQTDRQTDFCIKKEFVSVFIPV